MNELIVTNDELMTTKELAEVLGVDISTVKKTVKRLEQGGEVLHHLTKDKYNNNVFVFNEKQATLIKQEIQKHHNLQSRQIDSVATEEEENETIINALSILKRRADEYKHRAEIAESTLIEQAPKIEVYNKAMSSDTLMKIGDVAKVLNLKVGGQKKLFEKLREDKILIEYNNLPYQKYIDAGYFKVVEKPFVVNEKTMINKVTMVTQKGVDFIARKYA